jgi:hypothetical protein
MAKAAIHDAEQTAAILAKFPVLDNVAGAVARAVRCMELGDMFDDVADVEFEQPPANKTTGKLPPPRVRFVTSSGKHDKVLVFGEAMAFDGFGFLINEKHDPKSFQLVASGTITRNTRVHSAGSTGEDMDTRLSVYRPFGNKLPEEVTKAADALVCQGMVVGGAHKLEVLLWLAAEKFAGKYPDALYPATSYKLPPFERLITSVDKGALKPPEEASFPNLKEARCANENAIPLCAHFVRKQHGIKADKTPAYIAWAKKELQAFLDVVEAIFGGMDALAMSHGAFGSLVCSAPAIRLLMEQGLDVSPMQAFFNSIKDDDIYKFSIPEIFGPTGEQLTVADLAVLTYRRPRELTPYIVADMSYDVYKPPKKDKASVKPVFGRLMILGLVPAPEIKAMASLEESCISAESAEAIVAAAFARRAAGNASRAIEAPPVRMAIEPAPAAPASQQAAPASPQKREREDTADDNKKAKKQRVTF